MHIRATIEPAGLPAGEAERMALLDMVGTDLLMFASDHPHEHGDSATALVETVTPETREAILRSTAAAFYRS